MKGTNSEVNFEKRGKETVKAVIQAAIVALAGPEAAHYLRELGQLFTGEAELLEMAFLKRKEKENGKS